MPKNRYRYNYILVIINRLSKRAFSLLYTKKITVARIVELYYKYIFRVFGVPETIILDRGT